MGKRLEVVHPNAAGIDIGGSLIYIDAGEGSVKSFATFTDSLYAATEYLQQQNVSTVAMEATGIYWVVLYDILEKAGIDVWLVNGRDVKHVPGRKSDVSDCQWIRQLHSYGLLRKSFIPNNSIRELRSYMRLRESSIRSAAKEINHMDKALVLMNIRISSVISTLNSKTGINLIAAIVNGETRPEILVEYSDVRILKTKRAQILSALKGNFLPQYVFALRQAYNAWLFFEQQVHECDKEAEKLLNELNENREIVDDISVAKPIRRHSPQIKQLHVQMLLLSGGKDVTLLPGITDYTALQLFSEVGTDMSAWATEKHFTSWLGLSPVKHSSGKMDRKTKGYKKTNAGNIFRQAAQALMVSKYNALGAFGRRMRSRKGSFVAIKAVARKLASMFYQIMTKGAKYVEQGVEKYEERYKAVILSKLQKQASKLHLQLVPAS